MIVIILIGVWGGKKLDELTGKEQGIYSALTVLFSVLIAIYIAIKDQFKKK